ncbi:serine/threonine protein kinase [Pontiella sulfatireligans]|uniref:Serine/threonine-protein kinase PknD n=1 Tax=Pontiella sulfatireligans TaxID=2750658 RepID=A0A6C2US44_9BACT|nr:serine/threonine-protein kinase [Pontiella sulfatireligans]VGO23152.1 Serine/threonine-protein kinase PknD [Pontiella sulfatireligans]
MREDYDQLNEDFEDRRSLLGEFFEPEKQRLDPDEELALNPIFEGLKGQSAHYSDMAFVCEGGEKKIFKVRDLRTDRIVAMAKPLSCETPAKKEDFLREARLTACLQHPNIVTIYDQGLDDDHVPYFTMEFIHGDNLRTIIERLVDDDEETQARYPRERLLEIFVKVCDAVSYAHSRGVAHLDIKPANIQVGPFGEVQLCDWGVSKVLSRGFDEQLEGCLLDDDRPNSDLLNDLMPVDMVTGTPGFIAPEQVGSGKPISELTDVYALGAVLYYLLTFRVPVCGKSNQEILKKTKAGELVPLMSHSAGRFIPKGLAAVARKALSLDPEDRYVSVQALRSELDRFMTGFATEAQHAGPLQRAALLLKRRPVVFRVIAISIVVSLLVLIISFFRVVHAKEEAVKARSTAEENLRLYIEASDRSNMFADNVRKVAVGFYQQENFMEANAKEHLLKLQLQETLDEQRRKQITHKLAMLHFVRQQFHQANPYFRQSGCDPETDRFFGLSEEFVKRKGPGGGWLERDVLLELMNRVPVAYDNIFNALGHYYLQTKFKAPLDSEEILPLIETLLDRLNHQGQHAEKRHTLALDQVDGGWRLSLAGKSYAVLNLPLTTARTESNVLNPLGLYALDISYSKINDPLQLEGSGIKELEMRGVNWDRPQIRMLNRLRLNKLTHSLDVSDAFLQEVLPNVELVRVNKSLTF